VYRARQVWHWLYARLTPDWDSMENLPSSFRAQLTDSFSINTPTLLKTHGEPGTTQKLLIGLDDNERIEEVLIPAANRMTLCVSSQVGCRFHCAFCASGQAGFVRHLEAGEIVGQILLVARVLGRRPTNIVYMGVGEPLDNYARVLKSVRIINDPDGLAVGARRITISTSGVVPGIRRLADEDLQIELSVSLHAARNDLRSRLMPINRKYPLSDLVRACREYSERTRRIVTFEYTLIQGVNDFRQDAADLAALLAPLACRVNLIPLSPVPEFKGLPSSGKTAKMFIDILAAGRINATLRESKGCSLNAACGQLRCS
jgi:23S rRNA (adenine2503-C2)-methyltransferase